MSLFPHHPSTARSSSSHVVIFFLGLFLRSPSLLSFESIFSHPLNDTNLAFLFSRTWRSPRLPGLGEPVNNPFLKSSKMLAICHVNTRHRLCWSKCWTATGKPREISPTVHFKKRKLSSRSLEIGYKKNKWIRN